MIAARSSPFLSQPVCCSAPAASTSGATRRTRLRSHRLPTERSCTGTTPWFRINVRQARQVAVMDMQLVPVYADSDSAEAIERRRDVGLTAASGCQVLAHRRADFTAPSAESLSA